MIYLFSGFGEDKWAIRQVLAWKNETLIEQTLHIHGTKDRILWYNCIKNAVGIENGGHLMIVNKAQAVQKILDSAIF